MGSWSFTYKKDEGEAAVEHDTTKCKIVSNIYENNIVYQRPGEEGRWETIDGKAYQGDLPKGKYSKRIFCDKKNVEEVIEVILKELSENEDSTVDIFFEGINKEYEILEKVCNDDKFCEKVKLQSIKRYLLDATDIIEKISKEFDKVQRIVQEYEKDVQLEEMQKLIGEFSTNDLKSDYSIEKYQILKECFAKIEKVWKIVGHKMGEKKRNRDLLEKEKKEIENEIQINEENSENTDQTSEDQDLDSSWKKIKKFYIEGFPKAFPNLTKMIQMRHNKPETEGNSAKPDEQGFLEGNMLKSEEPMGDRVKKFYVEGIKNIIHGSTPPGKNEIVDSQEINNVGMKKIISELDEKIKCFEEEIQKLEEDSKELEKVMKYLEWQEI